MPNRNCIIIETKFTAHKKKHPPKSQITNGSVSEAGSKITRKVKFTSRKFNEIVSSVYALHSGYRRQGKGEFLVPADASPNHNRATSKGDHSLDCFGFKVLPWTPPHTGPTIIRCKTEAAFSFISEQNLCPLGTCPPLVRGAPGMTPGFLVPGRHGFPHWTTCTQPDTIEPITYCLRTDCGVSGSSQSTPDDIG